LAGVLGERIGLQVPFWVGAVAVLVGAGVLSASRRYLAGVDAELGELDELTYEATAVTLGSES
jgi:ACDE family multidrug resistance protein